ncbi:MAG: phosphoglycerate kinase [Candidatus Poribacteria bacterium]|nr:phosphoglycerate kinase [Candidatus Poribacteria bacterium]
MPRKWNVHDLDAAGKTVLTRVDFNAPLSGGKVADDTRIRASLPTIRALQKQGAKIVLASHLGRPKGERNLEYTLAPVAERLSALLGETARFVPDCVGASVSEAVERLEPGGVLLLENLRFYPGEEANDPEFARQLASCADLYVNDAFGAAHRAHASTVGAAQMLPPAAAGLLMERELTYLSKAFDNPPRPFYAVLGGAKVSDKIGVLRALMDAADAILIGGAMAYTFLVALGRQVGNSLVEPDKIETARDLIVQSMMKRAPLYLPIDHIIAKELSPDAEAAAAWRDTIPEDCEALDIGPATLEMYALILRRAKMIVWNGPLGVYEVDAFAGGTLGMARALGEMDAETIIGGGDCAAAVEKAGAADRMTHVSTGGGAALEFLEGRELPGVAALTDKM